jgi:hypothetical protein
VKYELLLRGRAKADIRRAAKWYELQRDGLGREFVAEVDAALGQIEANPSNMKLFTAKSGTPFCAGFLTVSSTEFEPPKSASLL